jgi:hypothetical protein
MRSGSTAQMWMTLAGIVLLAVGLLGFISNPIVGSASGALLPTDTLHNVVHLGTGLLALYIAFGLKGANQVNATLGFGVLYAVIFAANLLSPTLFGLFSVQANTMIHVVHATVAVVSLGVGYMARGQTAAWSA